MENKKFKIIKTKFKGLFIIENFQSFDNRGILEKDYSEGNFFNDINFKIKEVFYTKSKKGVIRANHFQLIKPQSKYIRVLSGRILDVVVDLRKYSETYMQYFKIQLSGDDNLGLYIPVGFSHGYKVIEDAIVSYKCDEVFLASGDAGFMWNDPTININWEINDNDEIILSEKDKNLNLFNDIKKELSWDNK